MDVNDDLSPRQKIIPSEHDANARIQEVHFFEE